MRYLYCLFCLILTWSIALGTESVQSGEVMYQNTFDTYLIHVPTLLISYPVPVACQQPSVQTVLTKSSFCYHFLVDKRCSITPLHVSPNFFCCCILLLYSSRHMQSQTAFYFSWCHKDFEKYIKVHTTTRWTIRHGLMLPWFTDLMNVTEEVTIHRPNDSTLLSSAFIRGDLNTATRGPFIWSLISGFFSDEV